MLRRRGILQSIEEQTGIHDFGGLLRQVPAALDAEFGQQGRDVVLDSSHGDAQASGDFLVDAIAKKFDENFVLARTERHGGKKTAADAEKLFRFAGHAADEVIVGGDMNGVVGRRIAAHGTREGEKASGTLDSGRLVTVDFDIEAGESCVLVADEEHARCSRARWRFAHSRSVSRLAFFLPPNGCLPRIATFRRNVKFGRWLLCGRHKMCAR